MSKERDLLPCPMCGKEAIFKDVGDKFHYVECAVCEIGTN